MKYFTYLCFDLHRRTCLLILERGEGKERKGGRNIHVREKHQSVPSRMHPDRVTNPDGVPNLQPSYVPWSGIEPANFQLTEWLSNQLSHTSQGWDEILWIRTSSLHTYLTFYPLFILLSLLCTCHLDCNQSFPLTWQCKQRRRVKEGECVKINSSNVTGNYGASLFHVLQQC